MPPSRTLEGRTDISGVAAAKRVGAGEMKLGISRVCEGLGASNPRSSNAAVTAKHLPSLLATRGRAPHEPARIVAMGSLFSVFLSTTMIQMNHAHKGSPVRGPIFLPEVD